VTETPSDPIFEDARSRSRFELHVAGQVVYADYVRQAGALVIRYVYAPPPLRGTGAADRLMADIAAVARAEDRKIVPICGYAHAWLRSHKAHRDLLAG
jgi:predicted GNAT family acetyltransferase